MHRVSCVLKYLILQGKGVWGKPWLGIAPERRLADDGKRLDALDVAYHLIIYIREGVRGREGKKFCSVGPWWMTGSAWTRWTLCIHKNYILGEGFGEEWGAVGLYREAGG